MDAAADQHDALRNSADYIALIRSRDAFARRMTVTVLATFIAYFGALAWLPGMMASASGGGGTIGLWLTVAGMLLGIMFAVVYTWRMNRHYDPALRQLLASAGQD